MKTLFYVNRLYRHALLVLPMLCLSPLASADFWDPFASPDQRRYVQAELGSVPVEPVHPTGTEPAATASASVRTFGLVLQRAEQSGQFQYGLEGGIRAGYGSNREMFVRLAGTGSSVKVRSDLWMGDLTFGGFFSIRAAERLRFYVSSGPALYWGRASGGDRDTSVAQANGPAVVIDLTENGDDLGVAWYARAGVEWMFSPRTHIGVSVRKMDARMDFGSRGRVHMDEPSYLVTLGYVY
ncbi:hypothetical protein [Marinimicrobium sp. ABcell2]|uniref:hypothetical protein n=1 Tax=Marinimicrobium sp. ABcell2 TaxID=3069751 RepID=UPI0027B343A5|nr:hypothetical protein [Marinimicrobium sp. ABcell2]MDQ2075857.1 hypothetical protein [Marinimicrobium sp. ABcell2]